MLENESWVLGNETQWEHRKMKVYKAKITGYRALVAQDKKYKNEFAKNDETLTECTKID